MVKHESQLLLALMSGTSVDTIDAAAARVSLRADQGIGAELIAFIEYPIPDLLRARVLQLMDDQAGALRLACSLNFEIAEEFAKAAQSLLDAAGISPHAVSAIASHGQTVYHLPPQSRDGISEEASTLQLGEASVIAQRLHLPVISNFRSADMAVGGQGAPLVPFADYHLFGRSDKTVAVHNIGGIANITVLPAGGALDDVVAFDTGPGNVLIDTLVRRLFPDLPYDVDGRFAARGRVIEPLLERWMKAPYIWAPPPKSTGRELFGPQFLDQTLGEFSQASPEDLIATATRFTAQTLASNLATFIAPRLHVDTIYLAGGGARNPTLRRLVVEELQEWFGDRAPAVDVTDTVGVPSKARECIAFAILGFARLHRIPANVPSATGATRPVLLGSIYEP